MEILFQRLQGSSQSNELNYRLKLHQLDFLLFRLTYLIDDFRLYVSPVNDFDECFYKLVKRLDEIEEVVKELLNK